MPHKPPEEVQEEVEDPFRDPMKGLSRPGGIEAALAQQSTAITTLVAHLASQADPLGELGSTAVSSSSTKGVQRRERLQNEIACRSSTCYLQVMQQVHRRLHPGKPTPKTEADLAGLSFLTYLEKSGGFRQNRDAGLQMWLMGHIMEAAAADDVWLMKERLALAVVALDQSVADRGEWTLGYLFSLAEDPPISMFQDKTSTTAPFGKPFSMLVPPTWSAICLAYVKAGDIDHPQTRGIPEEEQGCQDRRCRRASIAQAKGQVSQETQGRPAGSVEGRSSMHEVNQVFDFDLAKPCDHHHTVPPGPCRVCHDDHKKSTKVRRPLDGDVSMHVWCGHLLRAVMKTRTPFSEFKFVRRCNHLQRSNIVSSSPAMPLPLPFLLDFEAMPSGLSCKKRSKLYFRRAINVVVLALNFWWADFKFVDVEMMRRTPSWQQRLIYNRIASLLRVDGPRQLTSLVSGGRRMPQLCARLGELSEALTAIGPGADHYSRTFPGREVPVDNSASPSLEPYRSLDAERLKLSGTGAWDPTDFLGDTLSMAFRNPDSLLFEHDYINTPLPKMSDPLEEIVKLCHVWDEKGLLLIHEHDVPYHFPEEVVKIFNAYKSVSTDRQIGDRRGRNATEARIEGPSRNLPVGPDLVELFVDPSTHVLKLSVTDRKDFYHQVKCSYTRAISNTIGPGIPADMLSNTKAMAAFLYNQKAKKSRSRMVAGDDLGASKRARPLGHNSGDLVFASFLSVLQGDHGGVEYACEAHHHLLASKGLLSPETRLVSDSPFQRKAVDGRSLYRRLFCNIRGRERCYFYIDEQEMLWNRQGHLWELQAFGIAGQRHHRCWVRKGDRGTHQCWFGCVIMWPDNCWCTPFEEILLGDDFTSSGPTISHHRCTTCLLDGRMVVNATLSQTVDVLIQWRL